MKTKVKKNERFQVEGKYDPYGKGWNVVDTHLHVAGSGVKGYVVASYRYEIEAFDAAMLMNACN